MGFDKFIEEPSKFMNFSSNTIVFCRLFIEVGNALACKKFMNNRIRLGIMKTFI